MEQITLGEISVAVGFLVTLISGLSILISRLKKWIAEANKEQMDSITASMDDLQKRIAEVDMNSCKNYLVSFLSSVEKGEQIDEIERERFYEQYGHYAKIGGNSYLKRKVEDLMIEKKI